MSPSSVLFSLPTRPVVDVPRLGTFLSAQVVRGIDPLSLVSRTAQY